MKSLSIKSKIILLTVIVVAFSLVSLIFMTVNIMEKHLHQDLELRATSIVTVLSRYIGHGLESNDTSFVRDIAAGAFCDADVVGICVYDSNNKSIYRDVREPVLGTFHFIQSSVDTAGIEHFARLCIATKIIISGDQKVGSIWLALSRNAMDAKIQMIVILIILGSIAVLMMSLIVGIIIARRIVQPIKIFINAVERLRSGDMSKGIDTSALNKDFVSLGMSFNIMQKALSSAFTELNLARDHLEDQVAERTAELQKELIERTRTDNALRLSEEKYRTLHSSLNEGLCLHELVLDGDGKPADYRILDINPAFEKLTGFKRKEISGQLASQVYKTDEPPYLETFASVAQTGQPLVFETYFQQMEKHFRISVFSPALGKFAALFSDITDQKTAERQRARLQEKLKKVEKMEALGVLAGGVAHDLNNMLGPLVGYPELILLKLPDDDPIRKQVERIGRSAKEAADVIQDLLTLARRGRYEMSPVNLNSIIMDCIDSPGYEMFAGAHPDVDVKLNLDPNLRNIMGSAPHLSKVILNLIINAFDAMPEGGKLTIETEDKYVKALRDGHSRMARGYYAIFKVSDTGVGIKNEDLDKIFEPYYSKKKMGRSGSGLGLAVVYGILKDHNGYYDVISKVGEGTVFILYFPISVVQAAEEESVTKDYSGSETILVVDDIEEQRQIASDLISSFGYTVKTAPNGREALEVIKSEHIDLVVLDMIMGSDFDGLETYKAILKIKPDQKAIIVSGFSHTDRVKEMQRLGAGRYIKKPYTLYMLGEAIRNELDKKSTNARV